MSQSSNRKKVYPARMFKRAKIVCPSCLKRYEETGEKCQHCGFEAPRAAQQFAFEPPLMERFMGNTAVIAQADDKLIGDVGAAVDGLIKKFPQLGLYFCPVELNESVSVSEFGFWMMNACPFQQGQDESDRAWSLLVLMDLKRGLLSLTPGYAIEAFIDDSAWEGALQSMAEHLAAGDYRAALLGFVKDAGQLLRDSSKNVSIKVKSK